MVQCIFGVNMKKIGFVECTQERQFWPSSGHTWNHKAPKINWQIDLGKRNIWPEFEKTGWERGKAAAGGGMKCLWIPQGHGTIPFSTFWAWFTVACLRGLGWGRLLSKYKTWKTRSSVQITFYCLLIKPDTRVLFEHGFNADKKKMSEWNLDKLGVLNSW